MRVLAVFVALLFIGSSIQQLPISNECMFKGFELLPMLQKFDLEKFKTSTEYASTLISKAIIAANVCFKSMTAPKLTAVIGTECKSSVQAVISTLRTLAGKFVSRDFSSITADVSTLLSKVSAAKSACL